MKNIHIIPTDKPSRLLMSIKNNLQFLKDKASLNPNNHFEGIYQNIYITSDEEIRKGDWVYCLTENRVLISNVSYSKLDDRFKIILTTDQDLIKDGVQAIDDEFLKWFVKNPSCESVEVQKFTGFAEDYLIIIPQEEPKQETGKEFYEFSKEFYESADKVITVKRQETFGEAIDRITKEDGYDIEGGKVADFVDGMVKGAEWQAEKDIIEIGILEIELKHTKILLESCEKALEERDEQAKRMYSEEEVKQAYTEGGFAQLRYIDGLPYIDRDKWFEQFKKKISK
jgi:hypothetical protein